MPSCPQYCPPSPGCLPPRTSPYPNGHHKDIGFFSPCRLLPQGIGGKLLSSLLGTFSRSVPHGFLSTLWTQCFWLLDVLDSEVNLFRGFGLTTETWLEEHGGQVLELGGKHNYKG